MAINFAQAKTEPAVLYLPWGARQYPAASERLTLPGAVLCAVLRDCGMLALSPLDCQILLRLQRFL